MADSTYIDPNQISQLMSYFQGNLPSSGGNITSFNSGIFGPPSFGPDKNPITNFLGSTLSKIPVVGGLFGKEENKWKPYVNKQGQLVWNNPNIANPVPVSGVPGANVKPGRQYQQVANQTKISNDLLPYLTQAINNSTRQTALSDLATSQITSPQYAKLQTDLFNQFGPLLNQIGNKINEENQLAQANTTNKILQGPGAQTVSLADQLQRVVDPEFYKTREAGAKSIQDLINSIDLSGKLSNNDVNQIGKSLAISGVNRGTALAPSNSDTLRNAMQYGNALYNRQQTAKSNLSDAISKASAFLPTSKSGIDAFQTATGRTSMSNPGSAFMPSVTQTNGNQNFGLAGSVLGNIQGSQNLSQTIQAQSKDWLDKLGQMTSIGGNMAKGIGSIAAFL